jgi:hypothetical protein
MEHRIDGSGYGTGWRRERGCGWVEGIEGPEAVGGVGSGSGEQNEVVTSDCDAIMGEYGFAAVIT